MYIESDTEKESETDEKVGELSLDDNSSDEEIEIVGKESRYGGAVLTFNKTDLDEKVSVREIAIGDFILCDLKTVKGNKKRYVAEVLEIIDDSSVHCSFLRQNSKVHDIYVYPPSADEAVVTIDEIVKILPIPEKIRRGGLRFRGLNI